MGTTAEDSVVDKDRKVWGCDNLYIAKLTQVFSPLRAV